MAYHMLTCNECCEEVEVYCDGDNAMMCPECRSIDSFSQIEEEEQEHENSNRR
jgi:virulence-associated protein VagC